MRDFVVRFLIAGVVMGVLDALWLTVVANKFYKSQIGPLLLAKPNLVAAVFFYIVYLVGVVAFAVAPALERQSPGYALAYGALLGLVCYATYDLTNLATLKGFTLTVVIVDLIWGVFLTATTAFATYGIIHTWLSPGT